MLIGESTDRAVDVPDRAWRLLPTIRNLVDDTGELPADELLALPGSVTEGTLRWLAAVAAAHDLPTEWVEADFRELCADGLPDAVGETLQGRDEELMQMLHDLNFLGGGIFYDYCRVHLAKQISRENWSVDVIRERFGIPEESQGMDGE